MLSFTSSLSKDTDGIAIFVNEKYSYRDNKSILSKNATQKINSFLSVLKAKKETVSPFFTPIFESALANFTHLL